jgi:hypothetical protein
VAIGQLNEKLKQFPNETKGFFLQTLRLYFWFPISAIILNDIIFPSSGVVAGGESWVGDEGSEEVIEVW